MTAIRQPTNRGLALFPNKKRVYEIGDSDDSDEDYQLNSKPVKRVRGDDIPEKPRYNTRNKKGTVVDDEEEEEEEESDTDSESEKDEEGIVVEDDVEDDASDDSWIVDNDADIDSDIDDDSDDEHGATLRDKVNDAIYGKNNSTMDDTLRFEDFDAFVWDSTFHSILQSPFYCRKLRDKIITTISSRGNGGFAGVVDFHQKFLEVLEAGQRHRDRVQIERVYLSAFEGKCDCCLQKRFITKRWRVTIDDQPSFYWSFGEVCENALVKIVAIYNAFLWLSRPHHGENNHGFAIGRNELGITQFGWKTPVQMRMKAHEAFRAIIRDMNAPTGIHLAH